jgi:hypothetical protein
MGHAAHLLEELGGLVRGLGELHPAALAPAPGVDLGLDHAPAAVLLGDAAGFGGVPCHPAVRSRDVELPEQFLGLVLVDVHQETPGNERVGREGTELRNKCSENLLNCRIE